MSDAALATQIYLILPEKYPDNIEKFLGESVADERVVSVMINAASAQKNEPMTKALIKIAQDNNAAVLLGVYNETWQEGISLVKQWDCDGLHLFDFEGDIGLIRESLGGSYILGGFCGFSRHKAMEQGENGADYIAAGYQKSKEGEAVEEEGALAGDKGQEIDQILAFMDWYTEVLELPLVAWQCTSLAMAEDFVAKGADFIAFNDKLWCREEGGMVLRGFSGMS